jgi:hypothetical protein
MGDTPVRRLYTCSTKSARAFGLKLIASPNEHNSDALTMPDLKNAAQAVIPGTSLVPIVTKIFYHLSHENDVILGYFYKSTLRAKPAAESK